MIRKTIILRCSPDRAFSLFTEEAGQWWPSERRHTEDATSTIRIEASGRFFERAHDGTEVELGVVRRFEPARRLVLDWYPGTGRANATKVEVSFEAVDGGTRVTVDHGPGAASHETFNSNAPAYDRSWDAVLAVLAHQG
jgi:uncharacterized protein YndB with AHSA1/START domain